MAKKRTSNTNDRLIENRRARFDYDILETLEVGIKLYGPEVKSVRDGMVSLAEGYVRATDNPATLTLYSINIGHYGPASNFNKDPTRKRILLAHKREIKKLAKLTESKGVTIVPLKMYFKNGFAKLEIGVGKGRGKGDKRQAISERESKRDIQRAMSRRA